eukprot:9866336-Alexandrium_andersonii.AAC.1
MSYGWAQCARGPPTAARVRTAERRALTVPNHAKGVQAVCARCGGDAENMRRPYEDKVQNACASRCSIR